MTDINYAEVERRHWVGDVTLSECRRRGSTHRAYGWACNPPPQWSEEQQSAYREGYDNHKEK